MTNALSPLVQETLKTMNLTDSQLQELFNPTDRIVSNKAIDSIIDFYQRATKLIVCGDYDCDGVSSTSIAVLLAKKCNLEVGYYIPNRLKEGYGVSKETITMAHKRGYKDVLIIDNGVKAHEEIAYAQALGMRVAVVDHHIIDEPVTADAFLHPDVCSPYEASMCASGLIYCVAERMGLSDSYMLALACTATVADVMPLWGKNRELVRNGIQALNQNQFLQFDALVKRNRFTHYSAKLLSFQAIPKINTVGRLGDLANVNTLVQYFTTPDESVITSYAKQLFKLNDYRKEQGKALKEVAMAQVNDDPIQIIVDKRFHEGLLGIVANQVAQETMKPTVVLTEYDNVLKGSARSMTFSLQDIFTEVHSDYFVAMGGHDFAYGMTLNKATFDAFRADVNQVVSDFGAFEGRHETVLSIDPAWITQTALDELRHLEPFGEGFKLPLMRIDIPRDFQLYNLNGYGFKYAFNGFPFDEAVFFTQQYQKYQLQAARSLIGTLDLDSRSKNVLFVEDFE
ncbi:single-stranded-DNA-specific exonuclease RecJ [Erysipelothrix sp. strain 2 (EsS2-6-Brazil)]|uniref:single-stranded-DNA-specific exonuclease RecJ n=1 Tax=Erysipelothrix sp. strain 2 (EsS2-6-Brazil) TaxID=2500549 RepID=UPI00190DC4BF|nr:DHH family phosphoesterase [Erysipelothrix sp. strain 2 (EsS2-6-Brazil)]MBK2401824.1 recombinase RecJ [Erysipelothrix sp. strain 2 (EsS2-6-Brazil)]